MTIDQAFALALSHQQAGRLAEAEKLYRAILAQFPEHVDAIHNLACLADQAGRTDVAAELLTRASVLRPGAHETLCNLGICLRKLGRLEESIAVLRRAVALRPELSDLHNKLAISMTERGRFDEAIAEYRQAIALAPGFAEAYNNLGIALRRKGLMQDAIAAFSQTIALAPGYSEAHSNLGVALKDSGQVGQAIAAYRRAIAINPRDFDAHGNLAYAMHFHEAYDAAAIAEEHRRWNRLHAEPLRKSIPPHQNNRDPDRRLRIGYISPDFREHPVGRFLHPLLARHDKSQFEIVAYAQVTAPDAWTHRMQACCDAWRNIVGMTDEHLAGQIRADGIDILVDLSMHTSGNRLMVFARKPAPVQVTYLAYCSSTGLEAIDYRLSDPYLDPPHGDDSIYSEKTVRLPGCYWCYEPPLGFPQVGPLPALSRGFVTFASLNNFAKNSEPALAAWARILQAVPGSRLLLHAHQGDHRQRAAERLRRDGIDPARVSFSSKFPLHAYLTLHQSIDIALDPFPYGGGTTSCDALWMGVPIVCLTGKTAVGRGGLSILSNIGLGEFAVDSPERYVQLACELARDTGRLQSLRSTLRKRMSESPLMDARGFAKGVENAYRQMWREWCGPQLITPHPSTL